VEELQKEIPELRGSMLAAMGRIVPSHLLDRGLFDFQSLSVQTGDISEELDLALDRQHILQHPDGGAANMNP
jgi:tRNA 2-thiocytidine biosynthesis protein TtcA